jgi:hypothetical protein
MGKKRSRGATAVMTVAGLALLLAVASGVALVTKTEPRVAEHGSKTFISERLGR